jgi:chemotaxis protein MotB
MAKREFEQDPPPSAPEWLVTYSDMVSLLVTFFVMLMSFSTDSTLDDFPIPGLVFGGRGGVLKDSGKPDAVKPPPNDLMAATDGRRGARIPHARPADQLTENLAEMGQQMSADYQEVDFRRAIDGLLVRFDTSAGFAPGSAVVTARLREDLSVLAGILEHYRHLVVVEGHTDSKFEPTEAYRTAEDLSAARAAAAAKVMIESSTLAPEVLQIAGLGAARPLGDEDTVAGRARNRRVEVRVLGLSNARGSALDAKRAEEGR